nr:NADH dehydrogenase [ubiquinone] 1 beta subcomplex subunit 7 isoform X1 [Pongo abelii]
MSRLTCADGKELGPRKMWTSGRLGRLGLREAAGNECRIARHRLREMVATQQEMMDAQLRLQLRDYCAHYLIRLLKCKRDSFPNMLACKQQRHDWEYCEHRDYVMRMKEFERERRLLQRKKRREKKAAELAKDQGPGKVDPKVAL